MGLSCVIVDDNATFLKAARTLLEREGVTVAGTGGCADEALDLSSAHEPDVMLVDIVLGEESGFDLARKLVSEGRPVILMSAYTESGYGPPAPQGTDIGFLAKTELSAASIRALLRTARTHAQKTARRHQGT